METQVRDQTLASYEFSVAGQKEMGGLFPAHTEVRPLKKGNTKIRK